MSYFIYGLNCFEIMACHTNAMQWKRFPRYWPSVGGIHRRPVNSHHKGPVTPVFFHVSLSKLLKKRAMIWDAMKLMWRHRNAQWWHPTENVGCSYISSATASQITSLTMVYSTVYSGAYKRKHQSSASLAFVRGIHRWPVNSPHKGPVKRKIFSFDDVIMNILVSIDLNWYWQKPPPSPTQTQITLS